VTHTQVVDTEAAREFMRETLGKVSPAELAAMAGELGVKHERFRARLTTPGRRSLGEAELRPLLRSVFATRRRVGDVLAAAEGHLGEWIDDLLTEGPPVARLEAFHHRLAALPATVRYDLGSELLHFTDPDRYWLWTRWVWDPATRTGALPLVTMQEYELDGGGVGGTYLRVGRAIAFVHATGRAAGLAPIGEGPFGVDVYLASVYCVYVYTTLRLRMTHEFTRVIPPLPELARRFLGVHGMEA
jgi:hypothetical protein